MGFCIIVFFVSLLLLLHTYLLYPFLINIFTSLFKKNYRTDEYHNPSVSILIAAYNEQKVIIQTLRNLYCSDYPKNKIEIIVGSDCSTDDTNTLVRELMKEIPALRLFEFNERRGKKFVINDLVKQAGGDILVFCDSNSNYKKDAIRNLVKYFIDPRVGGVCGCLRLFEDEGNVQSLRQEKNYWHYETWIKNAEGKSGVLIGSNGAIYSIRKELFIPMPDKESVIDGLFLSLKVLEQKKDFVFSPDAIACEKLTTSVKEEFQRKVRIFSRCFETLKKTKSLLFFRRPLVSISYWSHKIIRWLSPVLLICLFISNIFIIKLSLFFMIFAFLQILYYLGGLLGFILNRINVRLTIFELIFYFMMTNLAIVSGYVKFILKKNNPIWKPTPR